MQGNAAGLMAPMARSGHWTDRLFAARDRLLASPRFQHWAAAFPLTRPIARRRTRALFDLCAGFVYSQILLACVRLRLFEILAEGPQTEAALAERLALPRDATARLLAAAVSLELVSLRGADRFGLGKLGAAAIGNTAVAAMVEHHSVLYSDLQDPVSLLRGTSAPTGLSRYWPYAGAEHPDAIPPEQVSAYTALMAASQPMIAAQVLAACRLDRYRCLLDIGGGNGSFLVAVAARSPKPRLMLFDLPAVAEQARVRLAAAGLSERVTVFGGDFRTDALPTGADIVSLVRVIHDHDDEMALAILRAARAALPDHGTLLLAEPLSGTAGGEPIGAAYFGFYLLAMGSGRARSFPELTSLLQSAGFAAARLLSGGNPLLTSVIVARAIPAGPARPKLLTVNCKF